MSVRIVVADDHAIVREGLRALLDAVEEFELVGEVGTGREAVRAATALRPAVLIMDIHMPDGTGIDATREIVRLAPNIAVLMLTMFDDDDSVFAAMRAGARGYVLKGADPQQILQAIEAVATGHAILGPGVAKRALGLLAAPRDAETAFPSLTPREREVLDLVAAGLSNGVIARQLGVTSHTIGNHISNILAKLQVATRSEAIVQARDAGLGRPT